MLDGSEGIIELLHEDAAHDIDHQHLLAAFTLKQTGTFAGRAGGIIYRTQKPVITLDIAQRFALIPDMIAGGDDVHARIIKFFANLSGDAEAPGGVFAIDDHEVELQFFTQARQARNNGFAPRPAHNVT